MSEQDGRLRFDHEAIRSAADLVEAGKNARSDVPRSAHADYVPSPDRDPLGVLRRQNAHIDHDAARTRLERMAQSPLAFSRGGAAVQAADLRHAPCTGVDVTVHGDAHLGAFGVYASPERTLEFDLGDFGDTAYGAWESDVKRFVTSVVIAASDRRFTESRVQTAALEAAASYRIALRQFMQLGVLDRYYMHADVRSAQRDATSQRVLDHALEAATRRTASRPARRLTTRTDSGARVFADDPPRIARVSSDTERRLLAVLQEHRRSVPSDIAVLLSQYVPTDAVRHDDDVPRAGASRYLLALSGPAGDHLVLEVAEAVDSAAVEFGGAAVHSPVLDIPPGPDGRSRRIVVGQRMLQAVADPFLGWAQHDGRTYVVRQFREPVASLDTESLDFRPFTGYVDACGTVLARAHAQSPAAPFISGYTGSGTAFDSAVAEWSFAYAEQVAEDCKTLRKALKSGEI